MPNQHLVDAGYVDAGNLVDSQQTHQIDLVGPAPQDTSWQARDEQGLDITKFTIDWEDCKAICPSGSVSTTWYATHKRPGEPIIRVAFDPEICRNCGVRAHCTRGKGARILTLRPQERHEALQLARKREKSEDFKQTYRTRAGIEGTISEGVRDQGLRRARYVGLTKTHLQCLITAAAINLTRAVSWVTDVPLASTRKSRFAAFAA